jgi:hypothetical protein
MRIRHEPELEAPTSLRRVTVVAGKLPSQDAGAFAAMSSQYE